MVRTASHLTFSGPFFTGDPVKKFAENKRDFMEAVAEAAAADVRQQLAAGQGGRAPISSGVSPARVSEHVVGRVRSLSGKEWKATAVVSINNRGHSRAQGVALMAASSLVEGRVHAFRRTASSARKGKADVAMLLRGLT
jgi:hypothetical protein